MSQIPSTPGKSTHAYWYWAIVLFASLSMSIILLTSDSDPLRYARYVIGSVMVFFLPGYSFMRAFFPYRQTQPSIPLEHRWERVGFSLILSLMIVPILGFALQYTPWGISLTPITLILGILIITFASVALVREERAKRN